MKRSLIIALTVILGSTTTYAINKRALADSLNTITKSHANVASVKVNSVRVSNGTAKVYTNASLSHISLTPTEVDSIYAMAERLIFKRKKGQVKIYSDNMELKKLITGVHQSRPVTEKYVLPEVAAWVRNQSMVYETENGLAGKHIALWGSHGRYYNQQQQTWLWQRAKLWTTVEDVYTSSYTMPFLVPMLENAGAVVVQPRERDTQEVEQIVDDGQANVSNGAFTPCSGKGWATPTRVLFERENPFRQGNYSIANTGIEGEIRYTPSLPAGEYAVYVSYKSLPNSSTDAQYTVAHKGQKTVYAVNQQMGGGTWVYLGTFAFDDVQGKNYVALSSLAADGKVVTADAVKFGGGMGSIARYPQPDAVENTPSSKSICLQEQENIDSVKLKSNQLLAETSGMPRYLEASRYWLQYAGIPDSIYNYTHSRNDYTDDYCSRGMWVNYLAGGSAANPHQTGLGVPLHLSLAFHTDAGTRYDGSIVGTLMIYTDYDNNKNKKFPTGVTRQVARDLGDFMQTQIVEDMRTIYAPHWERRHLNNSSYAEARYPKVPAVLLELLSHQNFYDMQYGLDPRVRFVISRAIYKGMLRFVHDQYNTPYVVQPLPVQKMAMNWESESNGQEPRVITVSWEPREDRLEPTAHPTYYVVYTRKNDGDWDNGVRVEEAQYRFQAQAGIRYDVRVQAGNAGGVSMHSEVLSAYVAPEEKGTVMVLNAFTRVSGPDWFKDNSSAGICPQSHGVAYGKDISYIGEQFDFTTKHRWVTDDECGWGSCFCDQQATLTMGNTFDYPVAHGRVLAQMGYSYISANAYAVDSLEGFDAVDVIMGKQKTTIMGQDTSFHTFTPELQKVLSHYIQSGGRVMVSGAYIASDMQSKSEKAFIKEQLHYTYRCDHASKQGGVVVNSRMLKPGRYAFDTAPNAVRIHTENADCIFPGKGAVCVARYSDTELSAAVAYDGTSKSKGKTLCWAFMLESSKDFDNLYKNSMEWLME